MSSINRLYLFAMKVDTDDLLQVETYRKQRKISRSQVDSMIKDQKLEVIYIDRVPFIQVNRKPDKPYWDL